MLRSSARKLHMSLSAVFKYQSLALGSETESMRRIPTKIVNTRVHNLYIREKEKAVPDEVKDLVKNQKKNQAESPKTEDVADKK